MKEPIEPSNEDCCGSGCSPCIFEVYQKQLEHYKSGAIHEKIKENAMSQLEYSSYSTYKNIDICQQHRLLLFKQTNVGNNKHVFWSPGEHFLIKFSSSKQSFSRAYTPIKPDSCSEMDYDFAIIVKRYANGIVSNYLCNLNVGEQTLWRGPYGNYTCTPQIFSRIVMIAQGTGIAPFYSIIKYILSNEDIITKIFLIYCCKCINSILLRDELYMLKSYWNFEYVVHLSKESVPMLFKYKEPIRIARLTSMDVLNLEPFTEKQQFLICGSDNFMKHYSKCLQEKNVKLNDIVLF